LTIYRAGLRVSEVLNLKVSEIKNQNGEYFLHIKQSKGNKDRLVPVNISLVKYLRGYWGIYRPAVYLFEGRSGYKYSSSSIRQILKRANSKVYPHLLRHQRATELVNEGNNILKVMSFLGHNSSKATEIYKRSVKPIHRFCVDGM